MMELLAPAGDREALIAAAQNGADAVYLGGQALNARKGAGNFDGDGLKWAADYLHERGLKMYVTVNTLVKTDEMQMLEEIAAQIASAGADAVLVQDLGVLRAMRTMLPDIALHASTQMAINNRQGVRFAKQMGLTRAVLARELTFQEITECAREGIEIETFAHGALCTACSGQCLFSSMIGGRSGNRGMCAQPCRLHYRLTGAVEDQGYLLSARDLMTLGELGRLERAGVKCIKIEGRLKRPEYVAVVTGIYRRALDELASYGDYEPEDEEIESLMQIFNRGGFTEGYGSGMIDRELVDQNRPNHAGVCIGRSEANGSINLMKSTGMEDALVLRGKGHEDLPLRGLAGTAGDRVLARGALRGDELIRLTSDEQMKLARESWNVERQDVLVSGRLYAHVGEPAQFAVTDGQEMAVAVNETVQPARRAPLDRERTLTQLKKTGGTPYRMVDVYIDAADEAFLPVSMLNEMRREALKTLAEKRIEARRGCGRQVHALPGASGRNTEQSEIRLRAQASQMKVLLAAKKAGAETLIFLPEDVTEEGLEHEIEQTGGIMFTLVLPMALSIRSLNTIWRWASRHKDQIEGTILSNPAHFTMRWPGTLQADWGMNISNPLAVEAVERMGAEVYVPSLEMTAREIEQLGGRKELIVYGAVTLMQLKHCPIRAKLGGKHRDCLRCDAVAPEKRISAHQLIDRKGAAFSLGRQKTEDGCILQLYNADTLMLLRHTSRLPEASFWRLIFTNESIETVEKVVRLHRMALNRQVFKDAPEWAAVETMRTTTGHYFRGVE